MSDLESPARGYLSHFLLVEEPFASPDAASGLRFFGGGGRDAARRALAHGVRDRRHASLLLGGAGCGKSTLLDRLARDLEQIAYVVRIAEAPTSAEELAAVLLGSLGGTEPKRTLNALLSELSEALRDAQERGYPVAVLVDDADQWDAPLLGILGRWLDLPGHGHWGLQLVLAGTPDLLATLQGAKCRDLVRRIGVRRDLRPLRREESRRFVAAQLEAAGVEGSLFDESAYRRAFEDSKGVLADLCRRCDLALVSACQRRGNRVVAADFDRAGAVDEARGRAPAPVSERSPWLRAAMLAAAGLLIGALIGIWVARRVAPSSESVDPPEVSQKEVVVEEAPDEAQAEAAAVSQELASRFATIVRETQGGERVIRVVRGATVYDLMLEVYGRYSFPLLGEVERSNPWLEDADFILPGQLLRFPPDRGSETLAADPEAGSERLRSSY